MLSSLKEVLPGLTAERRALLTDDTVQSFISLTGDDAPVHTSDIHAQRLGFPNKIVHGLLIGGMYSAVLGTKLPGPNSVIHSISLSMLRPVFAGQTIICSVTVISVSAAARSITLDLMGLLTSGEKVSKGTAVCIFRGPD